MSEKINYSLVIHRFYPGCAYTMKDGGKGYVYEDYIWDEANSIEKPAQSVLDEKYQEIKRETDLWNQFINMRNSLLSESDKYATMDYPHKSEEAKQAWIDYRNKLRNLPEVEIPYYDETGAVSVNWPEKPL